MAVDVKDVLNMENNSETVNEENMKCCEICLSPFNGQEIGNPDGCEHSFCRICIQEWAKVSNRCPLDKSTFTSISITKKLGGEEIKSVTVQHILTLGYDRTCEECGEDESEGCLVECFECSVKYHLKCLDPPLVEKPSIWYCKEDVMLINGDSGSENEQDPLIQDGQQASDSDNE